MKNIRIGTRNSPLALWQAREVARHLEALGHGTELIPVVASGDKNLHQPLYALGITGVFTRDLDIALLERKVDIAVHSLKDVPTQMPQGVEISAVLERDYPNDVLVRKEASQYKDLSELKIATSSLRRRAFWKRHFPQTEFSDIRGNVQTRLEKLEIGEFDATIFSLAGIQRMGMNIAYEELPFMISAPGQGVVGIASRIEDIEIKEIVSQINHSETMLCTQIERRFLQVMEGGCTAPIGAYLQKIKGSDYRFVAQICSLDGKDSVSLDQGIDLLKNNDWGAIFAEQLLEKGGKQIMQEIQRQLSL